MHVFLITGGFGNEIRCNVAKKVYHVNAVSHMEQLKASGSLEKVQAEHDFSTLLGGAWSSEP